MTDWLTVSMSNGRMDLRGEIRLGKVKTKLQKASHLRLTISTLMPSLASSSAAWRQNCKGKHQLPDLIQTRLRRSLPALQQNEPPKYSRFLLFESWPCRWATKSQGPSPLSRLDINILDTQGKLWRCLNSVWWWRGLLFTHFLCQAHLQIYFGSTWTPLFSDLQYYDCGGSSSGVVVSWEPDL